MDWSHYLDIAQKVVFYASIAANITPTAWDNRALNWIAAALNAASLDFNGAKAATQNADVTTTKTKGQFNA